MRLVRLLLFPFAILYGLITFIRNKLYDFNVIKSFEFDIPTISVGNLSAGGTGKTPHVEYLIRLLSKQYKLATLSRGYGRKTKGYFIADKFTDAKDIGDEPMQFHQKFPEISVAVDANRVEGVRNLLRERKVPELILLDDAFQHRRIKPGLQILLTPYNDLYADDFMLPTGNLREYISGSARADLIVVTKCPDQIPYKRVEEISKKLRVARHQKLFFSKIVYGSVVFGWDRVLEFADLLDFKILLVTGIANPAPLIEYLNSYDLTFKHLNYPDHHLFNEDDVLEINSSFANLCSGKKKIVLTTEKDYVRLNTTSIHKSSLMYLPISIDFLNGDKAEFDKMVSSYVEKSKGDSRIS